MMMLPSIVVFLFLWILKYLLEPSIVEAQSLSDLQQTMTALKSYLNIIDLSRDPVDYILKLKGSIFLGYTAAVIHENFLPRRNNDLIYESIEHYDSAIAIFLDQKNNHLYGNVDKNAEQRLIYYAYLQRSHNLYRINRAHDAVESAENAIKLANHRLQEATALIVLADTLLLLGNAKYALNHYLRAVELKPEDLSLYKSIVSTHKFLDDWSVEEWLHLFSHIESRLKSKEASSIRQDEGSSFAELSDINGEDVFSDHRFIPLDGSPTCFLPTISIEAFLYDSSYGEDAVFQALSESAEMARQYDKSWLYLERCKKSLITNLHNNGKDSPEITLFRLKTNAEFVMKAFNRDIFLETSRFQLGIPSHLPIFIVGMMRSGSSLLETMLLSHPNVLTIGEQSFVLPLVEDLFVNKVENSKELLLLLQSYTLNRELDDFLKSMKKEALKLHNLTLSPSAANNTHEDLSKTTHIIDKMLFNFLNIGFIHIFFPNALIIHTVRDPLDTILSCYRNSFENPQLSWTMDLKTLQEAFRTYLEIMAFYRKILPTDRIYEIQYERLVKNPKDELRVILSKVLT